MDSEQPMDNNEHEHNGNPQYKIHSEKEIPWKIVKKAKRIVIKLGTRALINSDRSFDDKLFETLSEDIRRLIDDGKEIIIVSSGAVNAGVNALRMKERPRELIVQQVCAAVGNPLLMEHFQNHFQPFPVGQVLVTQEDFSNRLSYNNLRNTLDEMIKRRIIPVINENDVVSVNELQASEGTEYNFSDNDILAGLVAASMDAELLIIFSDIDGLYTKHPNSPYAEFIPYVPEITAEVLAMGKSGSKFGRGGMVSKLLASQMVSKAGGAIIIADAKKSRIKDLLTGKAKLTFLAPCEKMKNKAIWLLFGANLKGKIVVDEGAVQALINGASLLFNGIAAINGDFQEGDIVAICHKNEKSEFEDVKAGMFARAKINYSSDELQRFRNMTKEMRKEYFKVNNIREIISHENMAFTNY
jgi:glutamate 5-kinase